MTLSDLLVTYNQVRTPEVPEMPELKQDFHTDDRYSRYIQYVDEKKNNATKSENNTWQGWTLNNPVSQWFVGESQQSTSEQPDSQPEASQSENPTQTTSSGQSVTARAKRVSRSAGYNNFVTAYDKFLAENPQYSKYKDLLTSIAGLESSYQQDISNKHSSALGWFQFLDKTRSNYTNTSREEFASNPNLQFEVASRHMDDIMRQVSPYKDRAKELGLTYLQLVYGMWWRPKSMINYLKTGSDNYVNKGDNMTLQKILKYAS